jgi:hypothetical protein
MTIRKFTGILCATWFCAAIATAQTPTPAQGLQRQFGSIHARILEMAKDLPEAKYSWRPAPDVRSFGEVFTHIMKGPEYAAKAAKDPKAKWEDEDYKQYPTKAAIVAGLEKAIGESNAVLKATPESRFTETLAPWLSVIEHSAEHYGQLVAYYRSNGLVPPSSRPK